MSIRVTVDESCWPIEVHDTEDPHWLCLDIEDALSLRDQLTKALEQLEAKKPKTPVWRPWVGVSEVPVDLLRLRMTESEIRYLAVLVTPDGIYRGIHNFVTPWDDLLLKFEWSANGRDWFKCGILCEDEK